MAEKRPRGHVALSLPEPPLLWEETPKKVGSPKTWRPPPKWEKRKCWKDRTLLLTGITLDDLLGCLGELCWFLHQRGESDNIWLQCWCNCGCSRVKSKYFHHLRITAGGKWCGSNAQICIPPITAHSSNLIFARLHPHRWFIPTSATFCKGYLRLPYSRSNFGLA